ncbi:MAG: hypothetical protein JST08_01385 [Actinobacteria bacterium]|nr:hypothetical protein [Actinomycetota bacterium]
MEPDRRGRNARRRDWAVAIGLGVAIVVLLLTARADGRDPGSKVRALTKPDWTAAPLPHGWHEVDRPLTGVLIPIQVFAAATYPIVLHHHPGQCGPPEAVLAEMPPGGLLLQVFEYPARGPEGRPIQVPRLPRRPDRFRWADATWGPFECAGPSYKFDYRQGGRALQAHVWMNRATADPALKAGALRILDNLRDAPRRRK